MFKHTQTIHFLYVKEVPGFHFKILSVGFTSRPGSLPPDDTITLCYYESYTYAESYKSKCLNNLPSFEQNNFKINNKDFLPR